MVKDYNVAVAKDGHTTNEHGIVTDENLIEHYNWVWQNLARTKGKAIVIQADKIHLP